VGVARCWRVVGAVAVIVLVASSCVTDGSVVDQLLAEADAAAAAGRFEDAFLGYLTVTATDPTNDAAKDGLAATSERLIAMVPGLSVEAEVGLLRWLQAESRWTDVVGVLEASVVALPAGWGAMGAANGPANAQPQRSVYLDAYRIDRYEVTNLQYAAFVAARQGRPPVYWASGSHPVGAATHPVVGVSWWDAASYCEWAGKRLPTEAEWERACASLDGLTYPWGDLWDPTRPNVTLEPMASLDDAWSWLTPEAQAPAALRPVGDQAGDVSHDGVCDLAGNASEWVADWYDPHAYSVLTNLNPVGLGPPWNHSVRGGSWLFRHNDVELMVDQSRCAFRNASHAGGDPRIGFRCAADEH
jgi:formylglycine-generating enzyme required for sulfatase activity